MRLNWRKILDFQKLWNFEGRKFIIQYNCVFTRSIILPFIILKIEILDFGIVNMYFTKNLQELLHIHFFFQWRLSCGWSWQEVDVLHQSRVSRLVYRIFMNSNRTAWLKLLFIQPYPHNSQFNIAINTWHLIRLPLLTMLLFLHDNILI